MILSLLEDKNLVPSSFQITMQNGTVITAFGSVVNSKTGCPDFPELSELINKNIKEISYFIHEKYAGDCIFLIQAANKFALVRPPFSELQVHYFVHGNAIEWWFGAELPSRISTRISGFDLQYISTLLLNQSWTSWNTALQDVFELLGGSMVYVDGDSIFRIDLLAGCIAALKTNTFPSLSEAGEECRRLILASVSHKLIGFEDSFAIKCSGGLDSGIVATATAALLPRRKLVLINAYSTSDRNGDERLYFDAIANSVSSTKIYLDANEGASRTSLQSNLLANAVRPCKMALTIPLNRRIHDLASRQGAKRLLTGDGGDQLFLRIKLLALAPELLREAASLREAVVMASTIACRSNCSIWRVCRELICQDHSSRLRRHLVGDLQFPYSSLLDYRPSEYDTLVPNITKHSHLKTSKLFQYFGLRNAELNRISLNHSKITERKPFLFWPLIKVCLSLQRWLHVHGGQDRAVARMAFKDFLPEAIRNRAGKGAGQDVQTRFDYTALAERICEGPLCRLGVLSPDRVKEVSGRRITQDSAFNLINAVAVSDWMANYEITKI